jgi:ankyrin repeat protein
VKELAEVLAVDFDEEEEIPKLKPNWRWEDQEQALLTSCSSLITTVETDDSRIVQFSHFSVKEYLTSERLASSSGDVSRYHILLEPAHTILAQACTSILLQTDDRVEDNGVGEGSPLAGYAARHWVTHAQFENVSSFLRKAMEYLFDLDKPYFAAWVQLHDIDTRPSPSSSSLDWFAVYKKSGGTSLYYSALCGFQDLVEHLVIKYPQHVNSSGGYYVTPLFAALAGRHFQTAKLLRHNGAHVNVRGGDGETPLVSAACYGDLKMVQVLLDYKVDVNALGQNNWAPIHYVSQGPGLHDIPQLFPDVARLLLEHGADVNVKNSSGWTPLRVAADYRKVEVVRVLLEHRANVGAEDGKGRTPLHAAAGSWDPEIYGRVEIVRMLLEHGADVGAEDNRGRTPLHGAAGYGGVEVVRALLEHGANASAEDNEGRTPFQIASAKGNDEIMKLLSEHANGQGLL